MSNITLFYSDNCINSTRTNSYVLIIKRVAYNFNKTTFNLLYSMYELCCGNILILLYEL